MNTVISNNISVHSVMSLMVKNCLIVLKYCRLADLVFVIKFPFTFAVISKLLLHSIIIPNNVMCLKIHQIFSWALNFSSSSFYLHIFSFDNIFSVGHGNV